MQQNKFVGLHKTKVKREEIWGVLFAMIPLIGFTIFGLIPMLLSLGISFTELKSYFIERATWNGVENFKFIFSDERFYKSVVNTIYAALSVPISMIAALVIASLLNRNIKGKKIFRLIFFIPFVCSVVAISIMWKWMLDDNYGIINDLLVKMGGEKVRWLTDSRYFMPSMIMMGVWSGTGFGIILFSAALTNVNPAYYEAAAIDGAGTMTKFFRITLPAISPTSFYILIMGIIGALQDFPRFQIMGGEMGGPGESGLTVVFYLYNMSFTNITTYGMGVGSAVAWILAIFIMAITVFNFKISKLWVSYD